MIGTLLKRGNVINSLSRPVPARLESEYTTGFAGERPFSSLLPESEVVSRILLPPASPVFIHTYKTVGSGNPQSHNFKTRQRGLHPHRMSSPRWRVGLVFRGTNRF